MKRLLLPLLAALALPTAVNANPLIDQYNQQKLEKERCRYLILNIQWENQDGSTDWYIIENNNVINVYSGWNFPQDKPHLCSYQQQGIINENYKYINKYDDVVTTYSTFEKGSLVI